MMRGVAGSSDLVSRICASGRASIYCAINNRDGEYLPRHRRDSLAVSFRPKPLFCSFNEPYSWHDALSPALPRKRKGWARRRPMSELYGKKARCAATKSV